MKHAAIYLAYSLLSWIVFPIDLVWTLCRLPWVNKAGQLPGGYFPIQLWLNARAVKRFFSGVN